MCCVEVDGLIPKQTFHPISLDPAQVFPPRIGYGPKFQRSWRYSLNSRYHLSHQCWCTCKHPKQTPWEVPDYSIEWRTSVAPPLVQRKNWGVAGGCSQVFLFERKLCEKDNTSNKWGFVVFFLGGGLEDSPMFSAKQKPSSLLCHKRSVSTKNSPRHLYRLF